jgi:hemolysin activation/secretion protein
MTSNFSANYLSKTIGFLCVLCASGAWAQTTTPDAGSLMQKPATAPAVSNRAPDLDVQQETRGSLIAPGGVKINVASFKLTGNTAFPDAVLATQVKRFVGRALDMSELEQAAAEISRYYRAKGYFVARAYLPAQDVGSGNIEIAIIEGRLGRIQFERTGAVRLSEKRSRDLVAGAAKLGQPIKEQNVERGLMLLNDMPGVEVKSTLVPGATTGTSDLMVEVKEGARVTGSVDIDNYGNRYTGEVRAGASLNINDPMGLGDQLTLRGLSSGSGLSYARVGYSLPVGNLGTKAGVAYSRMDYSLGKDFTALNAHGRASVSSLFAVHPLIRSRNRNLYVTTTYDYKLLSDSQRNLNVNDKNLSVFSVGLSGDMRDALGGGGLTDAGLALTAGKLDLSGNINFASNDALTAKTNGSYTKLNYNIARLQRVSDAWAVYMGLSGQYAGKNLDTSEKFVLGGIGVRAYPQGEAAGNSGQLLNLEARYNVPGFKFGNLQLLAFVDTGHVQLNANTWAGWQPIGRTNFPNSYSLSGAGFGLNLYREGSFSARGGVAWKLGNNPGADALGRDADGKTSRQRLWLQITKQFNQ